MQSRETITYPGMTYQTSMPGWYWNGDGDDPQNGLITENGVVCMGCTAASQDAAWHIAHVTGAW